MSYIGKHQHQQGEGGFGINLGPRRTMQRASAFLQLLRDNRFQNRKPVITDSERALFCTLSTPSNSSSLLGTFAALEKVGLRRAPFCARVGENGRT